MFIAFDMASTMHTLIIVNTGPNITQLFLVPRGSSPNASVHIFLMISQFVQNIFNNALINFRNVFVKRPSLIDMINPTPGYYLKQCFFEMLPRVLNQIKTRFIVFMQHHIASKNVTQFFELFSKHKDWSMNGLVSILGAIIISDQAGHIGIVAFVLSDHSSNRRDSVV